LKTIILAAGYATRLYPLTLDRPKALLPVAGKPIIDYLVDEISTIPSVSAIYVVTNDKFHAQLEQWGRNAATHIPVSVLNDLTTDDTNKRGAIGDISFTIDSCGIDDDILVMAGDNFFTFKLIDYYNFFRSVGTDCVCAKEFDDLALLRQFAVASVDASGKLTDLAEKPAEPKSNLAVYASYFYKKDTVPMFKAYLEEGNNPDAPGYFVEWLYKRKPVRVYPFNGECIDIGTPAQYEEVNRRFK